MRLPSNKIMALLYWFIVLIFSTLEPWGNIDTRDFSYMGVAKFWEYNAYIVFVLGAMIILGVLLWRKHINTKTVIWMSVVNTMFIVMVVFDFVHFFPDPVQPISFLTSLIEIVSSSIAFCILIYLPRIVSDK